MACGSAVVASEVGGLKNTVVNGKTGFLCPYGDVPQFCSAIIRLLNDNELRHTLITNALHRYKEFYTSDKMADRYAQLYQTVLNGC
jgi:glycosyltransferase involved in cell wall biosynthesis